MKSRGRYNADSFYCWKGGGEAATPYTEIGGGLSSINMVAGEMEEHQQNRIKSFERALLSHLFSLDRK